MSVMDVLGDVMDVADGEGHERKGRLIITLDGPAASGKSSVARRLARRLGVPFVSSGLLYRAATYLVSDEVNPNDEAAVLDLLAAHEVELIAERGAANLIFVDDVDVSAQLHTTQVDANVSAVARHPEVRAWVNARLREIKGDFVTEGRDMGRVVFPQAAYKFYLSAPAEVRAARRLDERGASLQEVIQALKLRDERDAAQLAPAPDAVHIETERLTLEQVVETLLSHIQPHIQVRR